ncbi:MAG TPA: hypothetical protein VHQ01_10035 [Pyrinomonadaceae bacterium]|nr:hypothetical protein [Pyrinomonadaceae bacterium]
MSEAVINYATYRNSNYSWMLGRFVVDLESLDEFYDNAAEFVSRDAASEWRVSVVSGENGLETVRIVDDFNKTNGPGVVCDRVELKTLTAYQIESVAAVLPDGVRAFFEIAPNEEMAELIAAVSKAGQYAKIRTGGVTPTAFPRSAEIVEFVQACVAANVPFKATAGLHHPMRCFRPLTYAADSPSGTMHGFLNLFMMTGFAREGFRANLLEEIMEEEFAEVFTFEEAGAVWRNEFNLSLAQLERLRVFGIQSFGSCSFDEPVADLQKSGIL